MDLDAADPQQTFQEFSAPVVFVLKNKGMTTQDQYCLLGLKDIEAWKSFTWDDNTDKEDPAKVFDKFENIFLNPYNAIGLQRRSIQPKAAGSHDSGTTRH